MTFHDWKERAIEANFISRRKYLLLQDESLDCCVNGWKFICLPNIWAQKALESHISFQKCNILVLSMIIAPFLSKSVPIQILSANENNRDIFLQNAYLYCLLLSSFCTVLQLTSPGPRLAGCRLDASIPMLAWMVSDDGGCSADRELVISKDD